MWKAGILSPLVKENPSSPAYDTVHFSFDRIRGAEHKTACPCAQLTIISWSLWAQGLLELTGWGPKEEIPTFLVTNVILWFIII